MKKTIILLLGVFLISSCNNSSSNKNNRVKSIDKWYVGGTLHKSNISEWKTSTDRNKLATCGDFIVKFVDKNTSLDVIKRKAENLKTCIDEATVSDVVNNKQVSKIASLCAVLLDY
jgi:hypothetical protein